MKIELQVISDLVKQAAKEELLPRYNTVVSQHKADGSIVTEADLAMQNRMQRELLTISPYSVLLSEEMTVKEQQEAINSSKLIWCLDPLDGTSNYASGIPYFAVSLSLIQDKEVIMGLVYDPIRDECFTAEKNMSAELNNKKIECAEVSEKIDKAIAIIDLKRLNSDLSVKLVQQQPFASQRNFGASALDWCWLTVNRGQLYLHGKQNIWDYSAGHFIFQQAGGYACTLDGESIFSHKLEGRSVVAAVNKPLLQAWMSWLNGIKTD